MSVAHARPRPLWRESMPPRCRTGSASFSSFPRRKKADAKCEQAWVGRISIVGRDPRHWTAKAWFFEGKSPQRYEKAIVIGFIRLSQLNCCQEYIYAINRALSEEGEFKPLVREDAAPPRTADDDDDLDVPR